jgi:hypothetical protein
VRCADTPQICAQREAVWTADSILGGASDTKGYGYGYGY